MLQSKLKKVKSLLSLPGKNNSENSTFSKFFLCHCEESYESEDDEAIYKKHQIATLHYKYLESLAMTFYTHKVKMGLN